MTKSNHFTIHTDGGSRGNPGPAAIGVVVEQGERVIHTIGSYIGDTTNNQAEYQAVFAALTFAKEQGATAVDLFCDSELVVKQLKLEYKMKNKELAPWFLKVQSLINEIGRVRITHIRREENTAADALVNRALDER